MKIKSFGIIALLLVAVFASIATTASAAPTIPTNAIYGTTTNVNYVSKFWEGTSQIQPNYITTVVYKPMKAGSWDFHVEAYYVANPFMKPGVVEFAWRSGSGRWNVWRTAEYNKDEGTHITQRLTSGDSTVQFRIRMYNPNVGSSILKPYKLPTYCTITKV